MIQLNTLLSSLEGFAVLAGQGHVVHMGRRFRRGGSNVDFNDLVLILFVCALIALAIWGLSRYYAYRERRGYNSQRGLFRELCQVHELDWSGRRLLWQLARSHRLVRPADLFTDSQRFDLPDDFGPLVADRDEIARLRDRLFGARES